MINNFQEVIIDLNGTAKINAFSRGGLPSWSAAVFSCQGFGARSEVSEGVVSAWRGGVSPPPLLRTVADSILGRIGRAKRALRSNVATAVRGRRPHGWDLPLSWLTEFPMRVHWRGVGR